MADTIQFKRGAEDSMPKLADGEPGWCVDKKRLYIGTPAGNEKIADVALIATVEQHSETIARQEQAVTEHDQVITEQGETLTEHSQAITELNEELTGKLSAKAALAQAELEDEAELAAVVESFNALLAAMKAAGLMES